MSAGTCGLGFCGGAWGSDGPSRGVAMAGLTQGIGPKQGKKKDHCPALEERAQEWGGVATSLVGVLQGSLTEEELLAQQLRGP